MTLPSSHRKVWFLPAAVVTTITLFAATFFTIAEGVRVQQPKGLLPICIGTTAFATIMFFLTHNSVPEEERRVGRTIAIVGGETAAFVYGLMFLLLNIFGS